MNILLKTSLLALSVLFFSACSHTDTQRIETREFSLTFPNTIPVVFDGKRVNRDAYADIVTDVKEIAAAKNGNAVFKDGKFTVKGNAKTLDEVSAYINGMNKKMSKVVSIHVAFYKLSAASEINSGNKRSNTYSSAEKTSKHLTDFDVFDSLSDFKKQTNGATLSTFSVEETSTTNQNPVIFNPINQDGYFIVTPTMTDSSNTIAMWVDTETIQQPSAKKKMATFISPMKHDQVIVIRHLGYVDDNEEVVAVLKATIH